MFGPMHELTLASPYNLGITLQKLEKYDESETFLSSVAERRSEVDGLTHSKTRDSLRHLSEVLLVLKNYGTRFKAHSNWAAC
jgi:hypothetical protein